MRIRHTSANLLNLAFLGRTGRSGETHQFNAKRTMGDTADKATQEVLQLVRHFYQEHTEIKISHGLPHVLRVYEHASEAIAAQEPSLTTQEATEVKVAALLHDVDDGKYFPKHQNYENAREILHQCDRSSGMDEARVATILDMVAWVSCSKNGNRVPDSIVQSGKYFQLIPRWADRLEAVGAIGVVRCFQYNQENERPLQSPSSPRAQTEAHVWELATPDRFENYLGDDADKLADDMISHYYDKLLHVARPPPGIVRNAYLEKAACTSAQDLVEVCLRFGRSGSVDLAHIEQVASRLGIRLQ
jgi:uncharacterized protein